MRIPWALPTAIDWNPSGSHSTADASVEWIKRLCRRSAFALPSRRSGMMAGMVKSRVSAQPEITAQSRMGAQRGIAGQYGIRDLLAIALVAGVLAAALRVSPILMVFAAAACVVALPERWSIGAAACFLAVLLPLAIHSVSVGRPWPRPVSRPNKPVPPAPSAGRSKAGTAASTGSQTRIANARPRDDHSAATVWRGTHRKA
jgi:hypothetical protein